MNGDAEITHHQEWLELMRNEEVTEEQIDDFFNGKKIVLPSKNGEKPVLKAGGHGLLGCFGRHPKIGGHSGATQQALTSFGFFSENFINTVASASRLPDLLYFKDLRYHAQSRHDPNTYFPIKPLEDKQDFQQLFSKHKKAALNYLETGNITEFSYNLGIVLHMIQDLACHKGMTNLEHSFLDRNEDEEGSSLSPDFDENAYNLGIMASSMVIKNSFLPLLESKKEQLNNMFRITWPQENSIKKLLALLPSVIKYKLDYLEICTPPYKSRWFSFNMDNLRESLLEIQYIVKD